MHYTWNGKSLFIFHNFDEKPQEIVFTKRQVAARRLVDLIKNVESVADEKGRHTIILEAYGYRWFRGMVE